MIRIKVKLDMEKLTTALGNLAELGKNTTPVMRDLAGIMMGTAEDAFDEQRDPASGEAWPELNAAYKARRHGNGYTGKMLQVTGGLAASVHSESGHGYARVGTNHPFAAVHQFGASTRAHLIRARRKKALLVPGIGFRRSVRHPGSTIPARPFLGVGAAEKEEMREAILRRLHAAIFD